MLTDTLTQVLEHVGNAIVGALAAPLIWTEQLFVVYMAMFVVLAAFSYRHYYRRREPGVRDFFRFLFPGRIYWHPSARIDYGIYLINTVLQPATSLFGVALQTWLSVEIARVLIGWHGAPLISVDDWTAGVWLTFIIGNTLVADLSVYVVHRLHHNSNVLWPIHALHHSAEVLTPVTLFRKHPLWNFTANLLAKGMTGVFGGLFVFVFYGAPSYEMLFGINTLYVVYNFMGANLRHSHVWLSWGRPLSHLFISPAMHQIHHDPNRMRCNYGEMFAIWDWMFGTLYVPAQRETFDYGLGADEANPHTSLWRAYWAPLQQSGRALLGVGRRLAGLAR